MIVRSFIRLLSLTLLSLSPNTFSAVTAADIRVSVNQFLSLYVNELQKNYSGNTRIDYTISKLDPRLKMGDCNAVLQTTIKSQRKTGRTNVQVSCSDTAAWSMYVPVEINLYREVVITNSPIARGSRISANRLALKEINVSRLNGSYFTDLQQVIGMQAKRLIRADQPLISTFVELPLLIKKGESVLITAASKSLNVKMPGIALMDGHKGQQIRVRNRQSNKTIEARVTAIGQVSVAM